MLVVVVLGAPVPLILMGWFWFAAGSFGSMYSDFGGPLPVLTKVVLGRSWPAIMMLGYLAALPLALLFRTSLARDFALLVIVVGGLMLVMASGAALYLPLFQVQTQLR